MVSTAVVETLDSSVQELMSAKRANRQPVNIVITGGIRKPVRTAVPRKVQMFVSTTPFAVRLDTTSTAAINVLRVKRATTVSAAFAEFVERVHTVGHERLHVRPARPVGIAVATGALPVLAAQRVPIRT